MCLCACLSGPAVCLPACQDPRVVRAAAMSSLELCLTAYRDARHSQARQVTTLLEDHVRVWQGENSL